MLHTGSTCQNKPTGDLVIWGAPSFTFHQMLVICFININCILMKKFFSSIYFTFNALEYNNSFMLYKKNVLQDLNSQEKFLRKYKMWVLWECVVCTWVVPNTTKTKQNRFHLNFSLNILLRYYITNSLLKQSLVEQLGDG